MLTITNEEDLVTSLVLKNSRKEIKHIERMFELFMEIYDFICTHEDALLQKDDFPVWSTFFLFIRNFRILRAAYHSMMKGYYEISVAIQRMAFENHLLMYFFLRKPEEAEAWWSGRRFGLRRLKREARKSVSYDEVYSNLSEFVHANFETTRFFWKPKGEKTTIWTTDYVPESFYKALLSLSLFGVATLLIIVPAIFKDRFEDEPLLKAIYEFNSQNKRILRDTRKKLSP